MGRGQPVAPHAEANKQNARAITPTVPATRQAIDLPKRSMNTLLSLRLRATAVAVLAV